MYKYALTDHLGNTRVVFSDKNDDGVVGVTDIEQINNYYPFGLNMDGPWNGASGQYKFQYNNKEWNSDLGLNLNDYGARFYDPTIGRWNSVDLMSEKMRRYSPYDYAYDNPIRFIDDNGNEPADPGPAWVRTAQFALKHPIAAHRIGDVSKGATNISTDAARFSTRSASIESKSSVLDEPKEQGNQGSQVNAFRHVLWQATITNEFGSDIANQIGRAHEENATAIDDKSSTQLSNTTFKSLSEADESIDLANNIIGREIGGNNKGLEMKELALKVLDGFKTDGLWTATKQSDGAWKMNKTNITDQQYTTLKSVFEKLNNDGFTPEEQKKR